MLQQVKELEDALQAKDANIQSLEQQASPRIFPGLHTLHYNGLLYAYALCVILKQVEPMCT